MGRITVDLLRRRAEHNEGCLSNLKEIALHQQDIERIELIGDACRQLEIIYFSNNYISRIEGLHHLKSLKYLNLAVNNITVIDGLQGCEALERLDLTLNFIADPTSVQSLLANPFLESLHLTGNPCTKTEGYRAYVIHALPQLKELDGDEIIRAERITARQAGDDVIEVAEEAAVRVREAERLKQEMLAKGIDPFPPKYNEKGERVYGHTPEERLQMLHEQRETERAQKAEQATPQPGSIAAVHQELKEQQAGSRLSPEEERTKFGRLLLRNEGRVPFHMDQDDPDAFVLTVEPGKFISTTLLSVQVEVDVIRVLIKGKLLQVPVEEELAADAAQVQRSSTTGQLKVTVSYAPDVRERRGGARARLRGLRDDDGTPSVASVAARKDAVASTSAAPAKAVEPTTRSTLLEIEGRMRSDPVTSGFPSSTSASSPQAQARSDAAQSRVVKSVVNIPSAAAADVGTTGNATAAAAATTGAAEAHWSDLD